MFVFKTRIILNEINKHSPGILNHCKKALDNSKKDLDFIRIDNDIFAKAPNLSIDIAVMEKTKQGIVIPLNVGWSDIGSWNSLWDNEEKDSFGNVIKGKVI